MKTRLVVSVLFGLIAAIGVTVFAGKFGHAALVAAAARSGGHQTVASILIDGFIVVAVVVARGRVCGRHGGIGLWPGPRQARRTAVEYRSTAATAARGRGLVAGHGDRHTA